MKWRLAALVFLAWFVGAAITLAPAQFNGCPAGFCAPVPAAAPAVYQGPGDVVASATAWWGLRCYSAAYSGNVADVYAPADASHTVITCSAGGVLNETVQALSVTCAVSCTVKTLYNQAGTICSGPSPCDLFQATEANRPALTLNCVNSKYCMTGGGSASMVSIATFGLGGTNPVTFTGGARRTSGTSYGTFLATGPTYGFYFGNGANKIELYCGADAPTSQTDGSWHRLVGIPNSGTSSSSITVDGSTTSGLSCGGATFGNAAATIFDDGGDHLLGNIVEVGLWPIALSGGQITAMDANISAYWGI